MRTAAARSGVRHQRTLLATKFVDTFDRVDSATTPNPASDGGTWIIPPSGGTWGITGNKLYVAGAGNLWGGGFAGICRSVGTKQAFHVLSYRPSTTGWAKFIFGANAALTDGYEVVFDGSTSATLNRINGTQNLVNLAAGSPVWTSFTAIRMGVSYDTTTGQCTIYQAGQPIWSGQLEASAWATGTYVGFAQTVAGTTYGWDYFDAAGSYYVYNARAVWAPGATAYNANPWAAGHGPKVGDLIVVAVGATGTGSVSGVTAGGTALTKITSRDNTNNRETDIFYGIATSTSTTVTTTISGTLTDCAMSALSVSGRTTLKRSITQTASADSASQSDGITPTADSLIVATRAVTVGAGVTGQAIAPADDHDFYAQQPWASNTGQLLTAFDCSATATLHNVWQTATGGLSLACFAEFT